MSVVRTRLATVRRVTVAAAVMLGAGCAGQDRPTTAEWSVEWASEHDRLPDAAALLEGGQEMCDELVGEFRSIPDRLTPAPTEALDDAVDAWIAHAETIVFECPDDPAETQRLLDELDVLAAEIDAGLAASRG